MKIVEMENICLAVTDDLYRFLVGILPKEYGFEFFASNVEDTYFEVLFPYDSPIRKLNEQKIETIIFHVVPFEETTHIRVEMKSQTGRIVFSPCLGYEHGERIFSTKESLLDECIRLAWSPIARPVPPLSHSIGECVVCLQEGDVLEWPCHNLHVTCESCIIKIIARDSKCPLCREVMFN
jgi:hypothetical protein